MTARRTVWAAVSLLLVGTLASAADAPAAGVPEKPRAVLAPWAQPGGGQYRFTPFDLARRFGNLTPDQQAAINRLQMQRYEELRKETARINREIDRRFAPLVVAVLGPDQKDAFEQVLAALAERDAAVDAAREDAIAALRKLREAQPDAAARAGYFAPYVPQRKQDVIQQFAGLAPEQMAQVGQIQRDSWAAMRDAMNAIPRPDDWRDAAARRQYYEATQKARTDVEEKIAHGMLALLTPEQKKAYEAAQAIVDAHDKKLKDAEAACAEKLVKILGQEKFDALFGQPGFEMAPPPPGAPPPPPKAPKGEPEEKQTDF